MAGDQNGTFFKRERLRNFNEFASLGFVHTLHPSFAFEFPDLVT